MFDFFKKTEIDFIGKRFFFFALSGILMLIGLVAIVQIARGHASLGIDFSGGAAIQIKLDKPVLIEQARNILGEGGIKDFELQEVAGGNRFLVRLKKQTESGKEIREKIVTAFAKSLPGSTLLVEASTEVGPTVGKKLQKDALIAVTLSMIGIVVYIALRFRFLFGIAAVIATFHDVLVLLGIVFLLNKEITLLIVTALLTIAGYSLSDTVVVFDRIRENMKMRKKETFTQVINKAINDVLSRTFITGLTTFLSALSLFLFGGGVVHDFALTLLLGIVVGTYSSWFIASPLLLLGQFSPGKKSGG